MKDPSRKLLDTTLPEANPLPARPEEDTEDTSSLSLGGRSEEAEASTSKLLRQEVRDPSEPRSAEESELEVLEPSFSIVAIGASSGGLRAVQELLAALPDEINLALVLIQHLDASHESELVQILGRKTKLRVEEATHGRTLEPNRLYVIPPGSSMRIQDEKLQLEPRDGGSSAHLVDEFMFSLAAARGTSAIGVVLSGNADDGSQGLLAIKRAGGITFAQTPETATFDSMPRSAVSLEVVDFLLAPADIAKQLERIATHPLLGGPTSEAFSKDSSALEKIFGQMKSATGLDLHQYRSTTVLRRIGRRIMLDKRESLSDYAERLAVDRAELRALHRDLLINVTSFFRDAGLVETLKEKIFPRILESKEEGSGIRIWVAGCSTGQEAYSMAIALLELFDQVPGRPEIQIFATDLDREALRRARSGLYPTSIESEVSTERLRRFFTKEEAGYRLQQTVRDLCIFAAQNVISHPPFSRLDLISCRNLLIYLSPSQQKRVISTFHYGLNPNGILVLGSSESVGPKNVLFELLDKKHKIYAKSSRAQRQSQHFDVPPTPAVIPPSLPGEREPTIADWQRVADQQVMGRYAPAMVLVNGSLDILQARGRTSHFLELQPGEAHLNVSKMVRESLFLKLREAIEEAKETDCSVGSRQARWLGENGPRVTRFEVIPLKLPMSAERCFLILLEDESTQSRESPRPVHRRVISRLADWLGRTFGSRSRSDRLDRELREAREEITSLQSYLRSLIEESEASSEDLRSANEEILSGNEELQSTNEELQTAKEELQSVNEELTTVNEQLRHRNGELDQANNDLVNLLNSTILPIVMVDGDLRIRRFTAAAEEMLGLSPGHLGRPLTQVSTAYDLMPDLERAFGQVLNQVRVEERRVQTSDGRWHSLRVHPYLTADNQIGGALLVLIEIDSVIRLQEILKREKDYAESVVETFRDPVLVLSEDLKVSTASHAFYEYFDERAEHVLGRSLFELCGSQLDLPRLRSQLQRMLEDDREIEDFELPLDIRHLGRRRLELRARRLKTQDTPRIMISFEDVTEERERVEGLHRADRRKNEFLAILAHELRNPLSAVSSAMRVAAQPEATEQDTQWTMEVIDRQIAHMVRMVDDLLDISRISQGKIELRKERVSIKPMIERMIAFNRGLFDGRTFELSIHVEPEDLAVNADPVRLDQMLLNLVANSIKYSGVEGRIEITAKQEDDWVVLRIRDDGEGIAPEVLPRLFKPFVQARESIDHAQGGLGLGLALIKKLASLHQGTVEAHSDGLGHGSTFTIRLPRQGTESPPEPLPPSDRPQREKARILVVDDNEDSVLALKRLLELSGHQVWAAFEGKTALELAKEQKPEIAILDLALPGMNGFELASQLRALEGLEDLELIASSGYSDQEHRARAGKAGFSHYLVKPVDFDQLRSLL